VSSIGRAVAQQSLRGVLSYCNARQMTAPEAYIHFVEEDYADDGSVLPRPDADEDEVDAVQPIFDRAVGLSALFP
jgi:NAD(P)H-dependent FMN reductase